MTFLVASKLLHWNLEVRVNFFYVSFTMKQFPG